MSKAIGVIYMENSALFHGDLTNSSRILYTASDFAKQSLLHIQEIGTLQATKPHISRRNNLSSYLFFLVRSGSGKLKYEGNTYALKEGQCVFIDCKQGYSHETSDRLWSLSWVHFNGPTASLIYKKYRENGGLPVFAAKDFEKYLLFYKHLYDIAAVASLAGDMEINEGLSGLLTLLMADSWHPEEAQPGAKKLSVDEIRRYLDDNYSHKITLDDLAGRYFINKFYLSRMFKDRFGLSIMNYLLNVRITKAKILLRFTDTGIEEIGTRCGIGDVYYFSKKFKMVEGVSPTEFRRAWKE